MPHSLQNLRPKMRMDEIKQVYSSAPQIKKPEKEKKKKKKEDTKSESSDDLMALFAAELAEVGGELTSVKKKEPVKKPSSKYTPATLPVETTVTVERVKVDSAPPIEQEPETSGNYGNYSGNHNNYSGNHGNYSGSQPDFALDMEMDLEEDASQPRGPGQKKSKKPKKFIRTAAGNTWEDDSLADWDSDDFRVFCGDLGNEVGEELLVRVFSRYQSFTKAKVVRDKRTQKSRGYGFVSFKDPNDLVRAMREVNGKYVGNRPIKLRKSTWKDRNLDQVRKKDKEKKRLGFR